MSKKFRRAVFVVVYSRAKNMLNYLILKRKYHWRGWEFPKGGINKEESERSAVKRELMEETGLKPFNGGIKRFNFHGQYLYKKRFSDRKDIIGQSFVLYAVEASHGKVKIDKKEHSSYIWLDFKSAMKKLTHSNQKKCLRIVNNYLKNSKK